MKISVVIAFVLLLVTPTRTGLRDEPKRPVTAIPVHSSRLTSPSQEESMRPALRIDDPHREAEAKPRDPREDSDLAEFLREQPAEDDYPSRTAIAGASFALGFSLGVSAALGAVAAGIVP